MDCQTCKAIDCTNPDDIFRYSLQSGVLFRNIRYGFVLDCPEGYSCAGGYYPRTIIIPDGSITVTIPDSYFTGDTLNSDYSTNLVCCDDNIPIFAAAGTSISALTTLLNLAFAECAAKQAACENLNSPASGVPAPSKGTNQLAMSDPTKACLSVAYNSRLQSSKTTGRVFWHVIAGGLPPGLLLESQTGFTVAQTASIGILGTPTTAGNYPFTMLMSDSLGKTLQKNLTISVLGITNSPSAATVGTPYSFQFTAGGGTGPYTYSVLAAALPLGLTMNDTGLISGTPENGDENVFNVTVTDSVGQACAKEFTMTPSTVSTCASLVAGLTWSYSNDPALVGPGIVMTAGSGTFNISTPGPASTSSQAFGTVTNNTGGPITLRFKFIWSSTANQFGVSVIDFFDFSTVLTQSSPFTGTTQGDVIIGDGESHTFQMSALTGDSGGAASSSGTINITCV